MEAAVGKEKPLITLSDLSKHNDKTDCWIAVHNQVWDITDFISEHPGGPDGKLPAQSGNLTLVFLLTA